MTDYKSRKSAWLLSPGYAVDRKCTSRSSQGVSSYYLYVHFKGLKSKQVYGYMINALGD